MNDIIIKEQNLTKQKRIIRLHNNLINAVFSLSTDAKKLLLAIWLHADPQNKHNNIVKIYRKDIEDVVGLDIMNLNKQHREEIITELIRKVITIRDINNPNNFLKFTLIRDTKYKDGLLEVDLSPNILPYIQEAQEKLFTRFNILSIKPLTSSYAIRTYLLTKQFEDTGFFKISVEEFKKRLELQGKYKRMYDLKKYVLETAKQQINENTDLEIDYELEKKGRRYTNIVFTIKSKNPKPKPEPKQIEKEKNPIDEFKKFRNEIISQVDENKIILSGDDAYKIKDNLLHLGDKLLNNTDALTHWKRLYENRDKIKIVDKAEFEKEREKNIKEKLKIEILKTYFGKTYEIIAKNALGGYETLKYEILDIDDIIFKDNGEIDYIILIGEGEDGLKYQIKATLNQLKLSTK